MNFHEDYVCVQKTHKLLQKCGQLNLIWKKNEKLKELKSADPSIFGAGKKILPR